MSVEDMREKRKNACVAFMEFCQYPKEEKDLFCFFEGPDDKKYYLTRIYEFTGRPEQNVITFDCSKKSEVLRTMELIDKDESNKIYDTAFFVDRDFENLINKKRLYETPSYSIENFYVSKDSFGKILKLEFGIKERLKDYKKAVKDYSERMKEFNENICLFNAYIWYYIKHGVQFNLGNVKIKSFFSEMSILNIIPKKNIDLNFLDEKYGLKTAPKVNNLLNEKISELKSYENGYLNRGKFMLEFHKYMIESIIKANNDGGYFNKKYNGVEFNSSNLLSTLSNTAETPNCLIEFLGQYRLN